MPTFLVKHHDEKRMAAIFNILQSLSQRLFTNRELCDSFYDGFISA